MKTRVLTALLALPLVLGAIASANPLPVQILVALLVGIGCAELSSMQPADLARLPVAATLVLIGYWFVLAQRIDPLSLAAQLLALATFGSIASQLWMKRPSGLLYQAATLWIAAPLAALPLIPPAYFDGWTLTLIDPIFLIVVPIWIGDSAAYFIGKRYGRRLLAPSISPKKTVEGAVANLVGCVFAAMIIGPYLGYEVWFSAICGTLGGTLGQAGDLFQSALKRRAGVKDSGSLLPGHGGVLDRIDSLLFAIPLQALLLSIVDR